MKEFRVRCWASEEITVEAESEEQAEEIATENADSPMWTIAKLTNNNHTTNPAGLRQEKREDIDKKNMTPAKGYIYSDSLDEMVVKAFIYKGERFEWNDADCLYYSEFTDERWFEDLPVSTDNIDITIEEAAG